MPHQPGRSLKQSFSAAGVPLSRAPNPRGNELLPIKNRSSLTFTLQQEVSPEGDDGHLSVQPLLVPGEVHGEEAIDCLSRQLSRILAEDSKEHRREELNLGREGRKL